MAKVRNEIKDSDEEDESVPAAQFQAMPVAEAAEKPENNDDAEKIERIDEQN